MNPTRGNKLSRVELHLGHHSPRRLPARRLIMEALVPNHRLVTRSSHRARQQFGDVPFQDAVGGNADGIFRATPFQRLVNLRLGEGGLGPKDHLFAQLLLPLDLRQQQFFPIVGAVDVTGPALRD